MWIDTCQHTYSKHPTIITLSILCAGKLIEDLGHFCISFFSYFANLLSISWSYNLYFFHGVSIHWWKVKEIHAFFFWNSNGDRPSIEGCRWCLNHSGSFVLAFTICWFHFYYNVFLSCTWNFRKHSYYSFSVSNSGVWTRTFKTGLVLCVEVLATTLCDLARVESTLGF